MTPRVSFLFFLLVLLPGICLGASLKSLPKKALPTEIRSLSFGLPLEKFKQRRPEIKLAGEPNFREVYIEEFSEGPLKSLVYYFDAEGEKPYYEVIMNFESETARDAWVARSLKKPNHPNGNDWLFDSRKGYEINAWTFQNKLIFAAAIPGCEWDEDGDGKNDSVLD